MRPSSPMRSLGLITSSGNEQKSSFLPLSPSLSFFIFSLSCLFRLVFGNLEGCTYVLDNHDHKERRITEWGIHTQ